MTERGHAEWAMWCGVGGGMGLVAMARAFAFAAGKGWAVNKPLADFMVSGAEPHGREKLQTVRLYLEILHSPDHPREESGAQAVVDALTAPPPLWRNRGNYDEVMRRAAVHLPGDRMLAVLDANLGSPRR